MTGLESSLESLRSHCVKGKPNLQWKSYDIGHTRIMEHLRGKLQVQSEPREAMCITGGRVRPTGVPCPLEPE